MSRMGLQELFSLIKFAIFSLCLGLFGLQSYREMEKFASKVTSVATSYYDDEEVAYPTIAVCLKPNHKNSDKVKQEAVAS